MKKLKEKNGITLIALIVTIIVLLILAGVSIITIVSDDGILNKSKESVEKTEMTTLDEQVGLVKTNMISDEVLEEKDFTREEFIKRIVGELNIPESKINHNLIESNDGKYEIMVHYDNSYEIVKKGEGYLEAEFLEPALESEFEYEVDTVKGTVKITNYIGKNTVVNIPAKIEGKNVTIIGEFAFKFKKLKSINIPSTVVTLGNWAFSNNEIEYIKIPETIKTLGNNIFTSNKISYAEIPTNMTIIPFGLLSYNKLKKVNLPPNVVEIQGDAFRGNELVKIDFPETLTTLGDRAFTGNQLEEIFIPDSVKEFGAAIFMENKISKVRIPNDIKTIPWTFLAKNQLTEFKIPESVTKIEYGALEYNNLTSIDIPKNVTVIEEWAFSCNKIEKLNLPEGLKRIGNYAFKDNKIKELIIPNSVNFIAKAAFNDNFVDDNQAFVYARNSNGGENKTKIVSYAGHNPNVKIPETVTIIGEESMYYSEIKTLDLSNVKEIGEQALSYNEISNLILPNSLVKIGNSSFAGNKLKEINIPSGVEYIGYWAFGNNELNKVIIPNTTTEIGKSAFNGNNLAELNIPSSVTKLGEAVLNNNKFPEDIAYIYARKEDGSEDKTKLISYAGNSKVPKVPEQVTSIGTTFFGLNNIDTVILNNNITILDVNAFNSSSIKSIVIPESIKEIRDYCFYSCYELTDVEFKCKLPKVGRGIFCMHVIEKAKPMKIKVPKGQLEAYKNATYTMGTTVYNPMRVWFGKDWPQIKHFMDYFYE